MIIIIFIFIVLIFIYIYLSYKTIESFTSDSETDDLDKCNNFFDKNSFCSLQLDNNVCDCKFQKDDNRYNFDSPEQCCKRKCNKISPEECVDSNDFTKIPYYCNIGGECKKYNGTIKNSNISANHCGLDPLNNQLLLPYDSLESCMGTVDVCDKYNIPDRSVRVNKSECIKDVNCGFCSNDTGGGKCISGTASGPLDLQKYYYCTPESVNKTNKYVYGNHADYLLQGKATWNSP
jgi:hypothetical protein